MGERLFKIYKDEFKLQNHCYWRIANDNAVGFKWNDLILRPYYAKAPYEQLKRSVDILLEMEEDKSKVLHYNEMSLHLRSKTKKNPKK